MVEDQRKRGGWAKKREKERARLIEMAGEGRGRDGRRGEGGREGVGRGRGRWGEGATEGEEGDEGRDSHNSCCSVVIDSIS